MRSRSLARLAAASAALVVAFVQHAAGADEPPKLSPAQRKQLEQEADQLARSLSPKALASDVGTAAPLRLAIIYNALGDRRSALYCLDTALNEDRRLTRDNWQLLPRGEDAFDPAHLARKWRVRDGCLSVMAADPEATDVVYPRVWETKGDSTRLLERSYAVLRSSKNTAYGDAPKERNEPPRELRPRVELPPRWQVEANERNQRRRELRQRIVRLMLEPTADPVQRDKALEDLLGSKSTLMRETVDFDSRIAVPEELKAVHQVPTSGLKALERHHVFVDFLRYARFDFDFTRPDVVGERYVPHYAAFVTSGVSIRTGVHDTRRIDLGPADAVDAAIRDWRRAIERGDAATEEARRVARLVWAPVEAAFTPGLTTVYLSPDGELATLPWAALPGRREGSILPEDYALAQVLDGHDLVGDLLRSRSQEEYDAFRERVLDPRHAPNVHINPFMPASVDEQFMLYVKPRPPWTDSDPVLVVGGVDADLPASRREAARVTQSAGKRPVAELLGPSATVERVVAELAKVQYAHLAVHGFFAEAALRREKRLTEADDPYLLASGLASRYPFAYTGLLLAGSSPEAGIAGRALTSETIPEIDLGRLRLCVLSACRTGLGSTTAGEGVQGLVRAFHLAGCSNVVASLWNVNDGATETFMTEFYRRLWQERKPPMEALRQTQIDLYRHPERIFRPGTDRDAPVSLDVTKPVNASRSAGAQTRPAKLPKTTPPRWWAAFVLSGVGR